MNVNLTNCENFNTQEQLTWDLQLQWKADSTDWEVTSRQKTYGILFKLLLKLSAIQKIDLHAF